MSYDNVGGIRDTFKQDLLVEFAKKETTKTLLF